MSPSRVLTALSVLCLHSQAAFAYVGPGLGAGTVAVVLGILASIAMAFFAVLWYPIKRLFKKKKRTIKDGEVK
jgi:O-antigen/teichoic acid export membrane protein